MSVRLSCCKVILPNQEWKMSFTRSLKIEDDAIEVKYWSYCPFCGVEVTA